MHIAKMCLLFALMALPVASEAVAANTCRDVDGTPTATELRTETSLASHGMVIFGQKSLYMYHLPMWSGVHAWQLILEVSIDDAGLKLYQSDKAAGSALNTFAPKPFALAKLAPGFQFTGKLYHGHFEQGGQALPLGNAATVTATVRRIVMVKALEAQLPLVAPTYRMFGEGNEWYAAHLASNQAPDYDQVLSVTAIPGPSAPQVAAGIHLEQPGQPLLTAQTRLLPGQTTEVDLNDCSKALLSPTAEVYFSTSDLGSD